MGFQFCGSDGIQYSVYVTLETSLKLLCKF